MATTPYAAWNSFYSSLVSNLQGTSAGKFRTIVDGYFEMFSHPLPILGIEPLTLRKGIRIGDVFRKILPVKVRIAAEIEAARPGKTALLQIGYFEDYLDSTLSIGSAFKAEQESEWAISLPQSGDPGAVIFCECVFAFEINVTIGSN